MKPRALVIEPDLSGYRWRYVQWTIEALVEAGYDCTLWTEPQHRNHPLTLGYEVSRSAVRIVSHRDGSHRFSFPHAVLKAGKTGIGLYAAFAAI